MEERKVAAISDIHGNRWALEAVLEDIARRQVDIIVNLGDSLYGPLDPAGTARLLRRENIFSIQGNEDRILHAAGDHSASCLSLGYTRRQLKAEDIAWLKSLKQTAAVHDLWLCHGTPMRDDEYLLESVGPGGAYLKSIEQVADLIAAVIQPVVLCGHSHVFRHVQTSSGRRVINAGSVGLPAYCDEKPYRHCMESGSPHAKYALLTGTEAGWAVQFVPVAYDWEAAAKQAHKNGRPDWATWLQSGWASD